MNEGRDTNRNCGLSVDSGESNNVSATNSSSYYSSFQENRRSDDNANNFSKREEHWEDLRCLLSSFHHLVGVELPALLERTRASEARMDIDHQGHDEISRHCFDIRRCFRNMQELLSREDLLNFLDEEDSCNSDENNVHKTFRSFGRAGSNSSNDGASDGNGNNDVLHLRKIFANDLVQLSSISIFDDVLDYRCNDAISGTGVRELHRSLVVLAANRFPNKAKLGNDQISLLLARVLSLIEQESQLIRGRFEEERKRNQYYWENPYVQRNQYQRPLHDFEPLQSMISWLNREVTVERLSRGVLSDWNEAAIILKVPLKFLHESVTKRRSLLLSSTDCSRAMVPSRVVLSLRILIDVLLGALNALFEKGKSDFGDEKNDEIDSSCTDYVLSLSEWMLESQHHVSDESHSMLEPERNGRLCLMRLLDRYALELAEETLDLLRPEQEKTSPSSRTFPGGKYGSKFDVGEKRDYHGDENNGDCNRHRDDNESRGRKRTTESTMPPLQRIVKVLQYAAMATNIFSIIEPNGTKYSGSTSGTNGMTLVSAGLSRYLWRALARFIIDEVDCLDNNDNEDNEKNAHEFEECQIAATDVLFRLTKIHVQAILFHDQSNDDGESASINTRSRFGDVIHNALPPPLSEEEFSIMVITILRLLGHPNEFWTEKTQEWVASLLQLNSDSNKNDPEILGNSSGVDVGSKLRKVLHATLICSSYIPDAVLFEEQCRINLSLTSLLLPIPNLPEPNSCRKRKHTRDYSTEATSDIETRKGRFAKENDPWESFWAIRR